MLMTNLKDATEMLFNKAEMTVTRMAIRSSLNLFNVMEDDEVMENVKDMLILYRDGKKIYLEQVEVINNMANEIDNMKDTMEALQKGNDLLKDQLRENNRLILRLEEQLKKDKA